MDHNRLVKIIFAAAILVPMPSIARAIRPSTAELDGITERGRLLGEYDIAEWRTTNAVIAVHSIAGLPGGYTAVGAYHTHPDPNQFGEGFLLPAMNWVAAHNMTSYVGMSYSGKSRSYTPALTNYGGYGVTGDLIGNVP